MYRGMFELGGVGSDGEASKSCLIEMIWAFVGINERFRRKNPRAPLLYQTKIRYVWEPWQRKVNGSLEKPPDVWRDFQAMLDPKEGGEGNCKDFVAERIAEINLAGGDAEPAILERKMPDGRVLYHIILKNKGKPEDPSIIMGMSPNQADIVDVGRREMMAPPYLAASAAGSFRAYVPPQPNFASPQALAVDLHPLSPLRALIRR